MTDFPASSYLLLVVMLIVATAAIWFNRQTGGRGIFSVYEPKRVITKHELVMLQKLIRTASAHGHYHVCPQVSMGALIDVKRFVTGKERLRARNRFQQKICDFVIIDASGTARLVVELDDWSHRGRENQDKMRDTLLASAGVPTLRIANAKSISSDQLYSDLAAYLTSSDKT